MLELRSVGLFALFAEQDTDAGEGYSLQNSLPIQTPWKSRLLAMSSKPAFFGIQPVFFKGFN